MTTTKFTDGFSEKKFTFGANMLFWVEKWCILITLDLLKNFFNFFTMKGARRYMEIILMVFLKKKSDLRQMGHFCLKITHHNSGSTLRIYFEILHNERGERYTKVILFFQKKYNFGNWTVLALKWWDFITLDPL